MNRPDKEPSPETPSEKLARLLEEEVREAMRAERARKRFQDGGPVQEATDGLPEVPQEPEKR